MSCPVVGQLLKNVYGCRVVGSAGSADKVALLRDLGFDAAWNHKEVPIRPVTPPIPVLGKALAEHCPDGIDIYFENVGGETLEAVLDAANTLARIVACGMISQYDLAPEERYGVKNLFNIIGKQIKLQGFIVSTLAKGMEAEFAAEMAQHVLDGKVKVIEHRTVGLEKIGAAFRELFVGANVGKAVVQVAERDPFPVASK
ncbi:hypothetical protein MNEG_4454 [Monoraphidium neglectum]|uniref:Alcohol dehydrogenase-like C-terminal domain-containing protein n=1 Tax=Monoraphidium neglectum TaxID=145388 RepID=A0A0D2MSU2_9CHLO|nr:hypothetical protein MNEG_4454 [Monoraphidium neglectum]KIZ03502.1 hypothetical protein MNEG_4454 [Monoraphidium neglectum]|eukprot:XP_013902521.1 hypothetical protein MNEG_4454 [Monoraphidium neglectum]